MAISIKFCGGAQTVTGSMHLISTSKSKILLDCGLFQGRRDEYYKVNSKFTFNLNNIDASVLSHAHIDHCGNIPNLVKQGYRNSVYCTSATKNLCRFMLLDSGYIQGEDIKYVNKINKRRGLPPREPLYTQREARKALKHLRSISYHRNFPLTKDVSLTFYEAGHILGSAIPLIEIKTRRRPIRIAYAVDLGRVDMPLLKNPEIPGDVDYLMIEGTYGNREHSSIKDAEVELANAINKTIKRGGKVIIPSFALERTQIVVFFISQLMRKKKIKKIPIYVDGPLAVNVTDVFRESADYFDVETAKEFLNSGDPFGYDNVTYVKDVSKSKQLHNVTEPIILISASGMCENGRILHHLKNNIENPKNAIIVIGFMANNTLGKRIVERAKTVRIFGRIYELNAEVITVNAFSSHADKNGLLNYVRGIGKKVKGVFLVHGEIEQLKMLRTDIRKKLNINPQIPAKGDTIYLKS
ncbi:MAG: MBL fold metallo-hydrolase [Candidatus Kaelpia imicola]|nr:MBL fold metallo-hydrolase [Candidatus Kaelpia imicola]